MSELEIQENMSAEEAFMDTESAYEEIPEAFQWKAFWYSLVQE